ncbi:MAG: hypothetical protein ICV60_10245 [Pyrinomonadaceae bacterium]|nr:hypothetical protein [Pyrinomonadaceae bacterium]
MLLNLKNQLDALTDTLHLVSNVAGPVEPGQKVELEVVSGAPDLFATVNALDNPVLAGTAQLLTQVPVEIQVTWSVTLNGKPLKSGTDFLATNNVEGPSVAFLFKPEFIDLGFSKNPFPARLVIKATVRLRAWPTNGAIATAIPTAQVSKDITLELPLSLMPLEIPTILALFRNEQFRALPDDNLDGGFVLMVVPSYSYLQGLTEQMNDLLVKIDEVVRPIRTLLGLAAFLSGLTILRQALSAQPMVRLRHGDIDDLTDIHMRVETLFGADLLNRDLRPNDRVSSLIFMAPKGRKVGCYNDQNQAEGEGAFAVDVGDEMITLIPSLRVSIAELEAQPHVEVLKPDNDSNRFDDSMSSVQFLD